MDNLLELCTDGQADRFLDYMDAVVFVAVIVPDAEAAWNAEDAGFVAGAVQLELAAGPVVIHADDAVWSLALVAVPCLVTETSGPKVYNEDLEAGIVGVHGVVDDAENIAIAELVVVAVEAVSAVIAVDAAEIAAVEIAVGFELMAATLDAPDASLVYPEIDFDI